MAPSIAALPPQEQHFSQKSPNGVSPASQNEDRSSKYDDCTNGSNGCEQKRQRQRHMSNLVTSSQPDVLPPPPEFRPGETKTGDNPFLANPHQARWEEVEGQRPKWDDSHSWQYIQTRNKSWNLGDGANDGGESLTKKHIDIDPYAEGRPAHANYKLMISSIVPRPTGIISTKSLDGSSTNLAPFSYVQMINHDPPLFTVGFASSFDRAKDTLRNLVETGECCINMVSEHFVEAASICGTLSPYGVSEWALSGLTPAPCSTIDCSYVREAVFSVECVLVDTKEFESRVVPGKKTGVLAILEGVRFHVREDAINEDRSVIDPAVLRPMGRMGDISWTRVLEGIQIPTFNFKRGVAEERVPKELIQKKIDGQ